MADNRIVLCEHCIEAIRSRGEKVAVIEPLYMYDGSEIAHTCEWCKDEDEILGEDDLYVCQFV